MKKWFSLNVLLFAGLFQITQMMALLFISWFTSGPFILVGSLVLSVLFYFGIKPTIVESSKLPNRDLRVITDFLFKMVYTGVLPIFIFLYWGEQLWIQMMALTIVILTGLGCNKVFKLTAKNLNGTSLIH
jgi:hypothetical protein